MRKVTVLITLLVSLALLIAGNLGFELTPWHRIIINHPVVTVEILEPFLTLPTSQVHDNPYNYTTNASIIKSTNDQYISAFQTDLDSSTKQYHTKIEIIRLTKNFEFITHYTINQEQFYTFYDRHWTNLSTAQDPRLFVANDKIYMLYNDSVTSSRREMFITSLSVDQRNITTNQILKLNFREGEYADQKNWIPFVYNNEIYFIYSISPQIILHWQPQTNTLKKIYVNAKSFGTAWPIGQVRGGTPAIYIKEYDAYLAFFHSSVQYLKNRPKSTAVHQPKSRIYYTGAFLFAAKPPFNVIAYTPTPLSYPEQYSDLKANYHILFVCGLLEENNHLIVSAGVQDMKAMLFKVDKTELYKQFKFLPKDPDAT